MDKPSRAKRSKFEAKILVRHPSLGEFIAKTRDISDSGVYILSEALPLNEGDMVEGQVQGMPFEAPILQMQVMRLEQDGMGLRFILN